MAAITFDPATMSTGDATIDAQHKQLITIINGLLDGMAAGQGKEALGPSLAKLGAYTHTHFAHEEACMTRYACPVAAINKKLHAEFLATVSEFSAEFNRTGPTSLLAMKLKTVVGEWLRNHIIKTDTALRPCIAGQMRAAS